MKTGISSGLRVRPVSRSGSGRNVPPSKGHIHAKEECRSALLPVFMIAAVWSLGCWIMIWARLNQSFSEDLTNNPLNKINRRDILAVKLKQFLNEQSPPENVPPSVIDKNFSDSSSSILTQLTDPTISERVQELLMSEIEFPQLMLGAYLEPPLPIDETGFLKLRTQSPDNLTYVTYPYKKTNNETSIMGACSQNGAQWILPTFHPPAMDEYFEGNVFRKKPMFDKRWELASGIENNESTGKGYCPVDADSYLPWIHDMFPSRDGRHIEFIISNKRRCNTDPKVFQSDLKNLEPQVALMQPIPVKRVGDWEAESENKGINNQSYLYPDTNFKSTRYALATSLDDADKDGQYTRFICRFHTVTIKGLSKLKQVILGETLSIYPYNPEHANYLKSGSKPMLTSPEKGHDEQIWNSVYSIQCPVPELSDGMKNLTTIIASGESVSQYNGAPSIYIDLIPIRTAVRQNKEGFGLPGVLHAAASFDPKLAWGDAHILPRVSASGRWSNIPICQPPVVDEKLAVVSERDRDESMPVFLAQESKEESKSTTDKEHFLIGCVWASHSFSTRGQSSPTDSSTSNRLMEFLAYHTHIACFDHIYVYDNSDTSIDDNINSTLAPIINKFPKRVSRIPWPHRICNNNRPAHSNPGERSSQYAAEASCRARYGPNTEWLISMDVDEYLIPVGKWKRIRDWLKHVLATEKDTQILSFFQTRALPNIDLMIPYNGAVTKSCQVETEKSTGASGALTSTCAMKNPNKTFMETYNCEPTKHPKPQSWAWRAKKQIYRPEFVWNHFVHYSLVTKLIHDKPSEISQRFQVKAPYERRVNELTEGFMLHTKTTSPEMTSNWQTKCALKDSSSKSSCSVGIPSAEILGLQGIYSESDADRSSASGTYMTNCYPHSRVMELIPKLEGVIGSLNH